MHRSVPIGALSLLLVIGSALAEDRTLDETIAELQRARLFGEAFKSLEEVAEDSDEYGVALRLLGDAYRDGNGVEMSAETAIQYYRKSAEQGDPEGMFQLGEAYAAGLGVSQSPSSAYTWYDAAAMDSANAALRYAEIAFANRGRAGFIARHDPIGRLLFASESGLPRAKFILATLMLRGEMVEKDIRGATDLLRDASDAIAEAKTTLAILNHENRQYDVAKPLFVEALGQGDRAAAAYLGHYAENGIGEPVDRQRALEYYKQAPELRWATEARRRLEEHYRSIEMFGMKMYGSTRAEVRARFSEIGFARIGGEEYFDAFDTNRRIGNQLSIIIVAYSPGAPEYVGEITYRFDVEKKSRVRKVYDDLVVSLTEEYGEPTATSRSRGISTSRWVSGETGIQLDQTNGNDYVSVAYHLRPYSTALSRYVADKLKEQQGAIHDSL